MKRLLQIILIAILAFSQDAYAYNFYTTAPSGQMLYYYINGTTATVTYQHPNSTTLTYYSNMTGDLVIPDTINASGLLFPVTAIDSGCFRNCTGLTSITIPATIAHVGNDILNGCTNLARIMIKSGVWLEPNDTFTWGCGALNGVPVSTEILVNCGQMYGYIEHCAFANRNIIAYTDTNTTISLIAECGTMTSLECLNVFRNDSLDIILSYTLGENNWLYSISWIVKHIINGQESILFTDNSNQSSLSLSANISTSSTIDSILVDCHAIFNGCSTLVERNKSILIRSFPESIYDTIIVHDTVCPETGPHRVFIKDGEACDGSCITILPIHIEGFEDTDTIRSCEDIQYVRLNIEHSYIGDLYIGLVCPNGQYASIMNYGGSVDETGCSGVIPLGARGLLPNTGRGGAFLGYALDLQNTDFPCDSSSNGNEPGEGLDYYWADYDANFPKVGAPGTIITQTHTTPPYSYLNHYSWYSPDQSFNTLIGCPLNGEWHIEIIDGWRMDNGYVFDWELSLFDQHELTLNVYPNTGAYGSVSGGGTYHAGDEVRISAMPKYGYSFQGWDNGLVDNPATITIDSDFTIYAIFSPTQHDTDTVHIHDTITIYDTIVIHDTIVVGIDNVETINAKIYQRNGQVVVEGVEGNMVTLYDVNGRLLATKQDDYMPLSFDVPTTGTYMIKIGSAPARKVVVIR